MNNNKILINLIEHLNLIKFRGYDPYDIQSSSFPFLKRKDTLGHFLTQFLKYYPYNFRPLLLIRKDVGNKSLALFALSFLKLYKKTQRRFCLKLAEKFLTRLKENSLVKIQKNHCWNGHYFSYKSSERITDNTSTAAVPPTAFIGLSFLEHYNLSKDNSSLEIAKSIANYFESKIIEDRGKIFVKYFSDDHNSKEVLNATALVSRFYSNLAKFTNDNFYKERSKKILSYLSTQQDKKGFWFYSKIRGIRRNQLDYHQGFIIDSFVDFISIFPDDPHTSEYLHVTEKACSFYFHKMHSGSKCFYRYPIRYPVDIHNQANSIITASKASNLFPEYKHFARKVLEWTNENMLDPNNNYYYYQKWPLLINKINYLRWSQSWMLLALVEFITIDD